MTRNTSRPTTPRPPAAIGATPTRRRSETCDVSSWASRRNRMARTVARSDGPAPLGEPCRATRRVRFGEGSGHDRSRSCGSTPTSTACDPTPGCASPTGRPTRPTGSRATKSDARAGAGRDERPAWPSSSRCSTPSGRHKFLIVLQGMDTSGKDGTIKHVFRGVNPVGREGRRLQAPQRRRAGPRLPVADPRAHAAHRAHGDLQPQPLRGRARGARARPGAGDDVAEALRAHPRLRADAGRRGRHDREAVPAHLQGRAEGRACRNGSTTPPSTGSSSTATSTSGSGWDDYAAAFEDALSETSTHDAPWYVIPANRKWYRNLLVSKLLIEKLEGLDMHYPEPAAGLDSIHLD